MFLKLGKMRKIVQIAFEINGDVSQDYDRDSGYGGVSGYTKSTMYAVCNDGSVWWHSDDKNNPGGIWTRVDDDCPIPQD